MTDDVHRRLRAQTLLLSSLRDEARLTAQDDLLADVELIHLRTHAEAAKELLRRLEEQFEPLESEAFQTKVGIGVATGLDDTFTRKAREVLARPSK